MKLFMPKQHGAWAMVILPFWLGVVASGFLWEHIPFFFGWLLLYLSTYPMLLLFKRKKIKFHVNWTLFYLIPAIALLMFPLFERPSVLLFGVMMIPFFAINAYFSSKNKDRAIMNDFSAVFAFSLAGIASAFLPIGKVTEEAILVFIVSALFFIGSTFFVKTMIREKKNVQFKWISWCFHSLVLLAWLLLGKWLVAIAFIPSVARAIGFYGKNLTPKQIGIYEIINSAVFFILIASYLLSN
ncbi:YwiC-like family protein [Bacillus sp. FJAT-27445]|uniref:YwiC-like family protein n=1 Tax=Bacillus sp. FJAT-27445 TaxID=1679166 RepID=UPI00074324EA|nr:YwiC-like family protein [Bacillus sp. FJAT-27445]